MAEIDRGKVIRPLQTKLNEVKANGLDVMLCSTEIIEIVIALLKEPEGVEPIPYHRSDGTIFKYECRQCRTKIFKMDLFCRHCGRKVKWDE